MLKKPKKPNMTMCVAIAMFALALLVLFFNPSDGLYAKYKSDAVSEDGARVAKFDIGVNAQGEQSWQMALSAIDPKEAETCTLKITNSSEVAVSCVISVENQTKNIPLVFTVKDNGNGTQSDNGQLSVEYSPEKNVTHSYDLSIALAQIEGDNYMYHGQVDNIVVTVRYKQIN